MRSYLSFDQALNQTIPEMRQDLPEMEYEEWLALLAEGGDENWDPSETWGYE